eukprot:scaffold15670_cov112-Isochrysis_galbana.AAC.15
MRVATAGSPAVNRTPQLTPGAPAEAALLDAAPSPRAPCAPAAASPGWAAAGIHGAAYASIAARAPAPAAPAAASRSDVSAALPLTGKPTVTPASSCSSWPSWAYVARVARGSTNWLACNGRVSCVSIISLYRAPAVLPSGGSSTHAAGWTPAAATCSVKGEPSSGSPSASNTCRQYSPARVSVNHATGLPSEPSPTRSGVRPTPSRTGVGFVPAPDPGASPHATPGAAAASETSSAALSAPWHSVASGGSGTNSSHATSPVAHGHLPPSVSTPLLRPPATVTALAACTDRRSSTWTCGRSACHFGSPASGP